MISDRNGFMSPRSCLFDRCFGIGQRVHAAHDRMKVKLHTLIPHRSILALGHCSGHDRIGFQNHFIREIIDHWTPVNTDNTANLDIFHNWRCFFIFEEATDSN